MDLDSDDDEDIPLFTAAVMNVVNVLDETSSSSSSDEETVVWGGSKEGKSANLPRDFAGAYEQVKRHYFSRQQSLYTKVMFERRFGCPRSVFNAIQEELFGNVPFVQRYDATGKAGVHPLVRLVACFRILSYGDCSDRNDEYLQISESALHETFKAFCKLVIEKFGPTYLN